MKKTKEKRSFKESAFIKLIIIFAVLIGQGIIIWGLISHNLSQQYVMERGLSLSESGHAFLSEMLKDVPAETFRDDNPANRDSLDKIRKAMRIVCETHYFDYVYLFKLDPKEDGKRIFLLTVAGNEDDKHYEEQLSGYKTRVSGPFSEQEKAAAAGDFMEEPDIYKSEFGSEYSWFFRIGLADDDDLLLGIDLEERDVRDEINNLGIVLIIPYAIIIIAIVAIALIFVKRLATDPLQMLTKEQAEQKMLDNVTKQIQTGILPESFSLSGDRFDAAAFAESAKSVGGDFYDCFIRPDGAVCCVVGDVSGKGMAAAFFMALVKTMIREHLMMGESPADVLNYVNNRLCAENPEGMFATVFALVFDPERSEIRFANAGHTRPLLMDSERTKYLNPDSGMTIGVFEDVGITEESLPISGGQGILLYTDGVTEAANETDEFYGEERLLSLIRNRNSSSAEDIIHAVTAGVKAFQGDREPFDDLTVLALKVLP